MAGWLMTYSLLPAAATAAAAAAAVAAKPHWGKGDQSATAHRSHGEHFLN